MEISPHPLHTSLLFYHTQLDNPDQLLETSSFEIIEKGISYISSRWTVASKSLDKVVNVRLGRGFHIQRAIVSSSGGGADGNSHLRNEEIGKQPGLRSAAAGLRCRNFGLDRNHFKQFFVDFDFDFLNMNAYGGGGSPSSSSFIIRMEKYNQWLSAHAS
uniref:Uncharacterized protein n=1 Tax=Salix viminalis TaxID=40686 RepID=A0A6N2L6Z2_SALVM